MSDQPLMDDIELREFKAPEKGGIPSPDDASCKELEKRSTMVPSHLKWLVNGHTIHREKFDYKIRQFPSGFIIVAESRSAGIVGMVCGAIKEVYLHWKSSGNPVKVVYIFDLRVAQSHQKAGLGKRLVDDAHRRATDLGAKYAYLTVNGDNEKAQKLFLKLGYAECSTRFPVGAKFGKGSHTSVSSSNIHINKVKGEDAVKMLKTELKEHDFTPGDLHILAKSEFYLGTVVATTGKSSATVSMWNGSGVTTFWISRFLFPAEWYASRLFSYALLGIGFAVGNAWALHIYNLFKGGSVGWALGYSVFTSVVAFGVQKVRPLLDFVFMMMKNKDGSMKTRGRLFAPVERGPQGRECLKAAIAKAKEELMNQGFLAWICNLDTESNLRDAFEAKGNFIAKLMHKSLDSSEEKLPRTRPNDFHDPRDI